MSKWSLKFSFNKTKIYEIKDFDIYKVVRGNCKIDNICSEQRMKQIALFIMGYKPAVLFSTNEYEENIANTSIFKKYHHIILSNQFTILFHKEEDLKKFRENCVDDNLKFNLNHEVMGEVLGIPPKAINDFVDKRGYIYNKDKWIGLEYCGLAFGLRRKSKKECIKWIENNLKIPKEIVDEFGVFTLC